MMKIFFSFFLSFLFTFYIIPHLCALAMKFKVLDSPDGLIKKQKTATPYFGGVAVFFGFIVSLALTFPFENRMFLFLIGSTLLLFVGLLDDLIVMKPHQKFFGQIIAAFCFLKAGFYLKQQFFFNNFWNIPISLFWILSIINAFNLVDVMDGLASLLAINAVLSFIFLALYLNNYVLAILLAAFLGAVVAFFWFNKPVARIYLGDAGSLFIGGFLATIPFLFSWGTYNFYGYLTPIIILAIPLLEVGTLIFIRTYKRIPFYRASPDHFSLILQSNGWGKYQILAYSAFMSFYLFVVAFLFFLRIIYLPGVFIAAVTFLFIWFFLLFFCNPAK